MLDKRQVWYKRIGLMLVALLMAGLLGQLWSGSLLAADESRTFPQTGYTVSGQFLQYWDKGGGENAFGYPISAPANEVDPETGQTFLTQWFERTRFEYQPTSDGSSPVKIGALGKELRREAIYSDPDFQSADKLVDPDMAADQQRYFDQTHHNLRFRFLDYWLKNGQYDRFGYPISEERLEYEPVTGSYYVMQWFERARLEYHPQNQAPQDVLLGQLGTQAKAQQAIDFQWKLGHRSRSLIDPNGVFVDGRGYVYVNDRAGGRINKYAPNAHQLVNYWYMDGGSQAIAGFARNNQDQSNGAGQAKPADKPSADQAILYQIGPYQNKVRKLMGDGSWKTVDLAVTGEEGSTSPNQGLAIGDNDEIYVLKYANQSPYLVWSYGSDGHFVNKYVSRTEVSDPTGIALKGDQIYLADGASATFKAFASSGNGQGGSDQLGGQPTPTAATTELGQANGQATPTTPTAVPPKAAPGVKLPQRSNTGSTQSATSIGVDRKGNVVVGEPGFLDAFDRNGVNLSSFTTTTPGRGAGQLLQPAGIAFDGQDNTFVADPPNHQISIFDQSGAFVDKIQDVPPYNYSADSRLAWAGGLTVTPGQGGQLFVADPATDRIQQFDLLGKFQQKLPASKSALLAAGPDKSLYALSPSQSLVVKYNEQGKIAAQWGSYGRGNQAFRLPGGIATDPEGNVYIADTGNQRIVKFDAKGTFLAEWGSKGSNNGQFGGGGLENSFDGPTSLAFEPGSGRLYVVDPALARVQVFDNQGHFLDTITTLNNNRPFDPVLVAAPPTRPQYLSNTQGEGQVGSFYLATRDGLYQLDIQKNVRASVQAKATVQGLYQDDIGDGNVSNLYALTVDDNGNLFASDNFGRVEKFRLKN